MHYVTGFSCRSGYCSLALFLSTFPSISSFISFNIFSFRHLQLFFPHPLKLSVFPTRLSTLYSVAFHAFRHLGSLFLSVHSFPLSFSRLCVLSSSHLRFPSSFPASFQSSLLLICVSIVVLEFRVLTRSALRPLSSFLHSVMLFLPHLGFCPLCVSVISSDILSAARTFSSVWIPSSFCRLSSISGVFLICVLSSFPCSIL